jgi:hypothetical protein
VSKHSLLYLQTRGVNCHDLDVFWDQNGVFYLSHPRVIQKNYNLSLDEVAGLSTVAFAELVQSAHSKPNATKGLTPPLKLPELVDLVNTHKLGPISLELKGRHRSDYFDQFAQLYSYLDLLPTTPARFALLMFSLNDLEELNRRLPSPVAIEGSGPSSVILALTLTDNNSSGPIMNISKLAPSALDRVGVISASWKLWETSDFAASLNTFQKPVMAWNVDHREYYRFRDLMTSEAMPDYIITDFPLGLSNRLKNECDANPAADDLRLRLENRFFLIWSNALPRSIMYY